MAKTLASTAGAVGSSPGRETKISHVSRGRQNKTKQTNKKDVKVSCTDTLSSKQCFPKQASQTLMSYQSPGHLVKVILRWGLSCSSCLTSFQVMQI